MSKFKLFTIIQIFEEFQALFDLPIRAICVKHLIRPNFDPESPSFQLSTIIDIEY